MDRWLDLRPCAGKEDAVDSPGLILQRDHAHDIFGLRDDTTDARHQRDEADAAVLTMIDRLRVFQVLDRRQVRLRQLVENGIEWVAGDVDADQLFLPIEHLAHVRLCHLRQILEEIVAAAGSRSFPEQPHLTGRLRAVIRSAEI